MMHTALEGRDARAELGSGWRAAQSPPCSPPSGFPDPLWRALLAHPPPQTLPGLADRGAGLQGGARPLAGATARDTGNARSVLRFAFQPD